MGADDEDSIWFSEPRWKLYHEIHHRFVAGVSENWQGTSAMGEIDNLGFIFRIVLFHHKNLTLLPSGRVVSSIT